MGNRKTRVMAVVVASVLVLAAACSKGDRVEMKDGNAAATKAPTRTEAAGSTRFELRYAANDATLTSAGSFDFEAKKGRMTLHLGGQTVELLVVGENIYAKAPALLANKSKPWTKYSPSPDGTGPLDQLVRLADPRRALSRLALASQMKRVGSERVRGVQTAHFRGIVDLSEKSLERLPDPEREDARDALSQLGVKTYPVDLWLDQLGRVRRFNWTVTGGVGGENVKVTNHIELYNYGDPVSVTIPPKAQVADVGDLNPNPSVSPPGTAND